MAGLVLPLLIYAARAVQILADPQVPYDTLHTYLPLARIFLQDPIGYFSLPASVTVAPGAVLYMALWGANPVAIKSANLFIGLLSLVLASDAARRIAGPTAGAAGAWGFALSPLLVTSGVTLMGEAPFIFLVVAWLWASAYAVQNAGSSSARRNAAVIVAGACLAAATLTRGTWLYWLPIASLAGLVVAAFAHGPTRAAWLRLALVHVIAMLLVGAFVARQNQQFDRPIIATGSGAALYFGSNTVLRGYEPPFFGLTHDEFTVVDHLGQLSLEGDRRLLAVTRVGISSTPLRTLAAMYWQKLGAFLFLSRTHIARQFVNERSMRIALLVLGLAALAFGRKQPFVWLLAAAIAYQCTVHIPVLYNPRYSASALDPLLVPLAAIGFGWVVAMARRRAVTATVTAIAVLAGVALGAWHQRFSAPPLPKIAAGPHRMLQAAKPAELTVQGSEGNPFEAPSELPDGRLEITWHPAMLQLSGTALLNLDVPHLAGSCSELWLRYTQPNGTAREALVPLRGLKAPQPIAWGMNDVRLPNLHGKLNLRLVCAPGTVIGLGRMGLFDVSMGRHFRAQALGSTLAHPFVHEGN